MKNDIKFKLFIPITGFFLLSLVNINAQDLTAKQQEYNKNKVQIFTVKERDNLQCWIQEEFAQMNLTEEKEDEYIYILTSYNAKMGRLVDKDKDYSKEEILEKIDELVKRQNAQVKKILSQEEFEMHLQTYGNILLSIKNRIAEIEF